MIVNVEPREGQLQASTEVKCEVEGEATRGTLAAEAEKRIKTATDERIVQKSTEAAGTIEGESPRRMDYL